MIKRVKLPEIVPDATEVPAGTKERVVHWLARRRGLYADPDVVAALGRCRTPQALEFATAVLSVRGWRQVDSDTFENHAYRLDIEPECGGYTVNLLFSSRRRREMVAFDIVSETQAENTQRLADARAEAIRASVTRYVRLTVGHMPKALRWLKTSFKTDLSRRREANLPAALLGRVNREELDWTNVPPPVRETRLQFWLEAHSEKLPEKYYPTLAQCETTAEMRFLTPVLQHLDWESIDRNRLRYQNMELKVHWGFEGGHYDFLIEHRSSRLFRPVVVEVARPSLQSRGSSLFAQVQAAADASQFHFEVVNSSEAAARGNWWSRLIKEGASNNRFQSREIRALRPTFEAGGP